MHGVERGKRWKAALTRRSDLTYRYKIALSRSMTLIVRGGRATLNNAAVELSGRAI